MPHVGWRTLRGFILPQEFELRLREVEARWSLARFVRRFDSVEPRSAGTREASPILLLDAGIAVEGRTCEDVTARSSTVVSINLPHLQADSVLLMGDLGVRVSESTTPSKARSILAAFRRGTKSGCWISNTVHGSRSLVPGIVWSAGAEEMLRGGGTWIQAGVKNLVFSPSDEKSTRSR